MKSDRKTGTTKFGWCIDGHHSDCRASFECHGRKHECACQCHQEDMPQT